MSLCLFAKLILPDLPHRIPRLLQNTREFCKIPYNSTHESPAKIRMTFAGLILRQDMYLFPAILNFSYSSPFLYNETSIRGVIRYFSIWRLTNCLHLYLPIMLLYIQNCNFGKSRLGRIRKANGQPFGVSINASCSQKLLHFLIQSLKQLRTEKFFYWDSKAIT